jgi:hypothetical protein
VQPSVHNSFASFMTKVVIVAGLLSDHINPLCSQYQIPNLYLLGIDSTRQAAADARNIAKFCKAGYRNVL